MPKPVVPCRSLLRPRLLAAGAAAALLAAMPAAAHAGGWIPGPRFALGPEADDLATAAAADGSSSAIWLQLASDGRSPELAFQHAAPDTTTGPVQTIATNQLFRVTTAVAQGRGGGAVLWAAADGTLELTLTAADGTARPTPISLGATSSGTTGSQSPGLAVDDAGDALVAWNATVRGATDLLVQRIAADGTRGQLLDLGVSSDLDPKVAVAPDGTGWVQWSTASHPEQIARIAPDGMQDGSTASIPDAIDELALVATNDGAAVSGAGGTGLEGWSLPPSGDVLGARFQVTTLGDEDSAPAPPAIAADGTITLAWVDPPSADDVTQAIWYARIAKGAASPTGAPRILSPAPGIDDGVYQPFVAPAPGGSSIVAWSPYARASNAAFRYQASTLGPDGAVSDPVQTGVSIPRSVVSNSAFYAPDNVRLTATDGGGAIFDSAVVPDILEGSPAIVTAVYDATPPRVTASAPDTVGVAELATFSATATDTTGVTVRWDFGDGSGARSDDATHRYALAGTYDVTFTATDHAGNVTRYARTLTVTGGPSGPGTPTGPGTGPSGTDGTGAPSAPSGIATLPRPTRAAAKLRLTSAVRDGSRLTIRGTIAAAASGKLTLVYTQRSGRSMLTTKVTVKITKGRFGATLKLPRAFTGRFKTKPKVTVSYAGSARVTPAQAGRTVTTAKPRTHRAAGRRK